MKVYKSIIIIGLIIVILHACSLGKLNARNFTQIEAGMTQAEVIAILGEPDQVNAANLASIGGIGLSGTRMQWNSLYVNANIIFVDGKVKFSNFNTR
ncbi:hypothetical protein [Candidatus Marithrix sp. Canyon 246]|uniref:hypothetical protein n=1 Tax=Candidatus Marithrix sp. Canyon 246 TaxID=1827136 RepID=UPI00084A0F66|nr:hypothetical protein [Candidatus Marithrix sp. Canyon 246]